MVIRFIKLVLPLLVFTAGCASEQATPVKTDVSTAEAPQVNSSDQASATLQSANSDKLYLTVEKFDGNCKAIERRGHLKLDGACLLFATEPLKLLAQAGQVSRTYSVVLIEGKSEEQVITDSVLIQDRRIKLGERFDSGGVILQSFQDTGVSQNGAQNCLKAPYYLIVSV